MLPLPRSHTIIACLVLCASCSDSPRRRDPVDDLERGRESAAKLIPAELEVTPETAPPGARLNLRARIPRPPPGWTELEAEVRVDGAETGDSIALRATGEALAGTLGVVAPQDPGDHRFTLRGRAGAHRIVAHALVQVSAAPSCAEGEVREAGRCVPRIDGHHLRVNRAIHVNQRRSPPGGGGAAMTHPRNATSVDGVVVACMTDAIGLIPVAEMPAIEGPPDGASERLRANLVEVFMNESGIRAAERLLVLPDRGIVLSASRGADNSGRGGLATWRLPPLDAATLEPPEHLSSVVDRRGFGATLRAGERIYALHNPNAIARVRISDQGRIEVSDELTLPALRNATAIAHDGIHLLVAGGIEPGAESEGAGTIEVLDARGTGPPLPLGSAPTTGTPRGIAVLDDAMVAVANGALGIDLIDLSDPAAPRLVTTVPTPASAMGLSFEEGYLLVADWDNIRLYDASRRGQLRLLDALDGFHSAFRAAGGGLHRNGLTAANFVRLEGGRFLAGELDVLLVGEIRRGAGAPRLVIHDRNHLRRRGAGEDQPFTIRVSNGGRHQLDLMQPGDPDPEAGGHWCLAPGRSAKLELRASGVALERRRGDTAVVIRSNDPEHRRTRIGLLPASDYSVGDPAPSFRLPMVNICPDGSCPERVGCFDLQEELARGRPILLAAFASW